MSAIPDFAEGELWIINSTLQERYGEPRETQMAEIELRLDKGSTQLVPCPAIYWEDDSCHFVVCKTGDHRYRCQFFYRMYQIYGTGREEYNDLAECMVSLLQVQADHHASGQEENQAP